MNRTYRHLFFDLDHTLWDHVANANETLAELYHAFNLAQTGNFDLASFQETFHGINHQLWHMYHLGAVDQTYIRKERFRRVMEDLEVAGYPHSESLGEQYLELCPRKSNLMPYTLEILEYLVHKYPMSIITNGFDEIQDIKMSSSGLKKYFDSVITSEKAGWLKPHRGIFDFAMEHASVGSAECVMIGDNPVTDIAGAINCGIDQIYYNSRGCDDVLDPTYQINLLSDLAELL